VRGKVPSAYALWQAPHLESIHRAPMSTPGPQISSLALADDGPRLSQHSVLATLGLADDEFAQRIFASCGVHSRSLDLTGSSLPFSDRAAAASARLLTLAERAIDRLPGGAASLQGLDTIITSSLCSLDVPALAHILADRYDLPPDIDKYHLTGIGCASTVPLIRLASRIIDEDGAALVIAVDDMSSLLSSARASDPRSKIVGCALFGDGGAAAIIDRRAGAAGPAAVATAIYQLPGTLSAVYMELGDSDSYLNLSRDLPAIAVGKLGALVDNFLEAAGLQRDDVRHWLIHPGGRRILEYAQAELALSDQDVEVSYKVLAEHGNVGTPSSFYVLDEGIRQRAPAVGEYGLAITIGPGIVIGLMLLAF
jgi:alkylresorcinol/alkylpyrone synthase